MAACDYMHMQLWHLVPQRGDIELVALGDAFQRTRRCGDFTEQLHLRILLEIDELYETGQARHQDQPRIVASFVSSARASGKSPTGTVSCASCGCSDQPLVSPESIGQIRTILSEES